MKLARFEDVDLGSVYDDLAARGGDGRRPFAIVNMVSTVDGKVALGSRARQLGTPLDRQLMRRVRAACDALVYGAGTLRAENVDPLVPAEMVEARKLRGQNDQPLRVVVSGSGDVPLENLFFQAPGERPVIFTARDSTEGLPVRVRRICRVVTVGKDGTVDLWHMAEKLAREFSVRSMVVEGGPTLNYAMLRARLVDELLLTVAPKIIGGARSLTIAEGPELGLEDIVQLDLASVYGEGNELFLRYRLTH